jgi:hypothetical protein
MGFPVDPPIHNRPGSWADGSIEEEMKQSKFWYRRPRNSDVLGPPRRPIHWLVSRLRRKK